MTTADKKPGTHKPQFNGEWVKLGDLCGVCSGGTPKRSVSEYWNEGSIPWVKISDISGKFVSSTEELITEAGLKGSSAKLLAPGTLLYSIFASIGAVGILKIPAATNQAIAGLSIKTDRIERDYLYHFLKSRESLAKSSGRGAAQNNINLTILRGMEVPVPAIGEQKAIVEQLEIIATQIKQAETQLDQLDSLVKSQFVEMFGDPIEQPKYQTESLGEACTKIGSGATPRGGKTIYMDNGTPFIRSLNVHNGTFIRKNLAYIGEEEAKKLSNVSLKRGDVLLNITGASVARSCVLPDDLVGGRVNQHVAILRANQSVILPCILNATLTSESYQRFMLEGAQKAGATREAITKQDLERFRVSIPPLSLQQQFADFVARVDKLGFDCCRETVCCGVLFSSMSASLLCT